MSATAARPIFSEDFYTNSVKLSWWMNFSTEKTQSNGKSTYHNDLFSFFWPYRKTHAMVGNEGTIKMVPFSWFNDVQRYFRLTQDRNLIATYKRLKELEVHMQNSNSPELQALKQEIHAKGIAGEQNLLNNFYHLSDIFRKANHKSIFALTLIKVTNFIYKAFGWKPIETYYFQPLNVRLFNEKAFQPALQFTPQDINRSQFHIGVQNCSPLALPAELTPENFHKLELGLMPGNRLVFEIEGKKLKISYDKEKKEFILSYLQLNTASLPSLLDQNQDYQFDTTPLNIVERNLHGTQTILPLKGTMHYTYPNRRWYSPFIDQRKCTFDHGRVVMKANNQYIIPLSQGDFRILIYNRNL